MSCIRSLKVPGRMKGISDSPWVDLEELVGKRVLELGSA